MLLAAPTARAALDMFMQAGSIKGESPDKEFKDAMDVLAWSWGMSSSGSTHQGGGGGAGKANFQDLSFTKWLDKATPSLMMSLAKGSHIPEVKLTVRKAGKEPLKYLIITMKNVLVTSLSTGGSGGEDRLTENVTLNFAEVSVEYFEPDEKGGTKTALKFDWNIAENAAK
jgi:type VI secretion system secreted protein Hcp